MCQIVFDESDHCAIARALRKNKSTSSKTPPPPAESAKSSFAKYIASALKESTIEVGQTYYSDRTKDEFEQDVATLGAHKLASNPVIGSNKVIRTELGRQISLHDQVKYRGPNGLTTIMSYKEAYALQQQNKSKKKVKESHFMELQMSLMDLVLL